VPPRTFTGEFDARPGETAEEARRLAEALRTLAADRDQALARIAALERNLEGVTGSIKRDRIANAQPAPVQAVPQAPAAAAAPVARPEPAIEAAIPSPRAPAPQQSVPSDPAPTAAPPDAGNRVAAASPSNPVRMTAPAEPIAAAPQVAALQAPAGGLGVDVGGAIDYSGLRALWRSTKNTDPALLEELYPVVTVRENGKSHNAELRLVVGPIADAEAAERLCATLAAAHHYCQAVAFEGQRLAVGDTSAPLKAAPAPSRHSGPNHSEASPSEPGSLAFKTVPESPSHVRAIIGK
jgi:hypothetical protein